MAAKRRAFCNGYDEIVFLCNVADRHEIREERPIVSSWLYYKNSENFPLRGDFAPDRHFAVILTGLRATGVSLQVNGYVSRRLC